MNAYVFQRISTVPVIARHVPTRLLVFIAVVLWGGFFIARFLNFFRLGAVPFAIEFNWIGVLFMLITCLLAVDIVTGFGFLLRDHVAALRSLAVIAALLLAAVAFGEAALAPVVRNYEVQLAGLPADKDGTVVVLASDLHIGPLQGEHWVNARVDQIASLHPDMVVLAGDIIDGGGSERRMIPALQRLRAPQGVWAVTGNHEFYGGFDESVEILKAAGFNLLRDRSQEVSPGLIIAGVDDVGIRGVTTPAAHFVETALNHIPNGAATIFVSHTPVGMEAAARAGAGLMLSGHTHNGQIWPFNYIVQRRYPLLGGQYNVNGMSVIVCRGTGTWGPRMRLGYPSEIVRIVLRAPSTTQKANAQPNGQAPGN